MLQLVYHNKIHMFAIFELTEENSKLILELYGKLLLIDGVNIEMTRNYMRNEITIKCDWPIIDSDEDRLKVYNELFEISRQYSLHSIKNGTLKGWHWDHNIVEKSYEVQKINRIMSVTQI